MEQRFPISSANNMTGQTKNLLRLSCDFELRNSRLGAPCGHATITCLFDPKFAAGSDS